MTLGPWRRSSALILLSASRAKFADAEVDTLLNPTVIVGVLSPTTEAWDRGGKFEQYQQMPSVKEYVLIAQDAPGIEHYLRQGEHWQYTPVTDLDGSIALPTLGCELQLLRPGSRTRAHRHTSTRGSSPADPAGRPRSRPVAGSTHHDAGGASAG